MINLFEKMITVLETGYEITNIRNIHTKKLNILLNKCESTVRNSHNILDILHDVNPMKSKTCLDFLRFYQVLEH